MYQKTFQNESTDPKCHSLSFNPFHCGLINLFIEDTLKNYIESMIHLTELIPHLWQLLKVNQTQQSLL